MKRMTKKKVNWMEFYDKLRFIHSIVKSLPETDSTLMDCAIDGVDSALYMAEHLAVEYEDGGVPMGYRKSHQKSPKKRPNPTQ